jgi:transposase
MSITSVFRRLLGLQDLGVRVVGVNLDQDALAVFVDVMPRRRRLQCPRCHRRWSVGTYDSRVRLWRHLDLGAWEVYLRYRVRRFGCPHCDTVVTEQVPWADPGSAFVRDFEDLVSFHAQHSNRTITSRVMRVAWQTVGKIVLRTVDRYGLPLARRRLYRIGVDEISYRKHHKYLTVVADHDRGQVVWAGEGKSGATFARFLDELGAEGCASIQLVSMDMSEAYISAVKRHLPNAVIVFDRFHVTKLANHAVDLVRRAQVRAWAGHPEARAVKGTRWLLLKSRPDLDLDEVLVLADLRRINRPLFRAYLLKESLRQLYEQPPADAKAYLKAWCQWASRSRLPAFVHLARTMRRHQDGILAAVEHGLSNGRLEGLNSKIRLLSHRAFGFHSADALIALVCLCCSGISIPLPHERLAEVRPYAI